MQDSWIANIKRLIAQALLAAVCSFVAFALLGFGIVWLSSSGWLEAPASVEEQRAQEKNLIDWAIPAIVVVAGLGSWYNRRQKNKP